jgi:putative transcriptional regulator
MLLAAASGAFAPAFGRVIEAHAALCSRCRATMANVEAVGGHALERERDADLAPDALDQALTAIERVPSEPALLAELKDLPPAVHHLIAPLLGKSKWKFGGLGLKLRTLDVPRMANEKLRLLRIEPGGYLPRHTHDGHEFVLILTGAYRDETGVYRAGDVAFGDASLEHLPVAEPGPVCYALAATTSPLRFTGAIGVLQRLFNIPSG